MTTLRRITKWLDRIEDGLSRFVSAIAIVCLLAIVAIVFTAVVLRYGFNLALIFSYDVSTVLFAWLIFLGLIVAERADAHMGIDVVSQLRSARLQHMIVAVRYALLLLTALYLCKIGIALVERTGNQIPSLRVSARWLYTALPIGFGLLSTSYAIRLLQLLLPKNKA